MKNKSHPPDLPQPRNTKVSPRLPQMVRTFATGCWRIDEQYLSTQ